MNSVHKIIQMKFKLLIIFIFINTVAFAQKPKYPFYILPNNKKEVFSKTDTLWVITHKQLKKTIKVSKLYKIEKKQNLLLKKQVDSLKEMLNTQQSLIDTLKSDRNFYKKMEQECEEDLTRSNKISEKYNRYMKYAIGGGIVFSIASFFLGAYLFH